MNKELRIEKIIYAAVLILLLSVGVAYYATVRHSSVSLPSVNVLQWSADSSSWGGWDLQIIKQ